MNNSLNMRELFLGAVEASPVDIYLSGNGAKQIFVPCRMQPPHESYQWSVDLCDDYILDSGFNRPDITNTDVLDRAVKIGANAVLLEDVYQNFEATVETLTYGKRIASAHEFSGRVIYPLQKPYVKCWDAIGKPKDVAIGGLKNASDEERIKAATQLRHAGFSGKLHGLGWGISDTLAREIRDKPNLIDSVDSRTPQTKTMELDFWSGTGVTKPMALHTAGYLLEMYRKCGQGDDPYKTTTLGDFA